MLRRHHFLRLNILLLVVVVYRTHVVLKHVKTVLTAVDEAHALVVAVNLLLLLLIQHDLLKLVFRELLLLPALLSRRLVSVASST